MKLLRSFSLWCVALLAVAALTVALHPQSSGASARITHLESLVRCPSCEDLSVGESNATSALAVRHEIATKVHEGQSDNQILTSILLSPPTSGLGALLWIGPVLVVVLLVASAIRLTRRR